MLRVALSTISLSLFLTLSSQTISFSVEVPQGKVFENANFFAMPIETANIPGSAIALNGEKVLSAQIPTSAAGLYTLYCSNSREQFTLPVAFPDSTGEIKLTLLGESFSGENNLNDSANLALASYDKEISKISRAIGHAPESLSDRQIHDGLKQYLTAADSIINLYGVDGSIANYIRLWAYTTANDALQTTVYVLRRAHREFSTPVGDFLPAAETILDCPMATWFYSTPITVQGSLKGKTTEARLAELREKYSTSQIINRVSDMIIERFLNNFDYVNNYDAGLARLIDMTARYNLPQENIEKFKRRRATVPGASFPEAELYDRNGNKVDFSKFAGKYVYVDMWASWCGPCCAEVPYLQKLEQELEEHPIEFVSISVDTDHDSWIDRMDKLNMKGNQLIDQNGAVAERLNIRAIPHFLLFDPQGKLVEYKTTRPSDEKTRQRLLQLK